MHGQRVSEHLVPKDTLYLQEQVELECEISSNMKDKGPTVKDSAAIEQKILFEIAPRDSIGLPLRNIA